MITNTVHVFTDNGWLNFEDVFTPTGKIKKYAKGNPVKVDSSITEEIKSKYPMVQVRKEYYFIVTTETNYSYDY